MGIYGYMEVVGMVDWSSDILNTLGEVCVVEGLIMKLLK